MFFSQISCILDKSKPRKRAEYSKNGVLNYQVCLKYKESPIFSIAFHFLSSDLGKIYTAIPWKELVLVFKIKEFFKGTKNHFSPKGKLALMFLKHDACCSDKRLIEQLNANIDYQFFCDIHLGHHRLTNYKIESQIRCKLSGSLNIAKV